MPPRYPTYLKLFARRLNAARQVAGLTQEALGVAAGLDEFVASSRMNHYERAKHWPDYGLAIRLAEVLNVPVAYFYAFNDEEADVLLAFHRAEKVVRDKWLAFAKKSLGP